MSFYQAYHYSCLDIKSCYIFFLFMCVCSYPGEYGCVCVTTPIYAALEGVGCGVCGSV